MQGGPGYCGQGEPNPALFLALPTLHLLGTPRRHRPDRGRPAQPQSHLETRSAKEKIAENKKRQRGLEVTTEELESACESFKKPSKILRMSGPVASSSMATPPHDDSSISDPQVDDGQE